MQQAQALEQRALSFVKNDDPSPLQTRHFTSASVLEPSSATKAAQAAPTHAESAITQVNLEESFLVPKSSTQAPSNSPHHNREIQAIHRKSPGLKHIGECAVLYVWQDDRHLKESAKCTSRK